jgi:membrane-bound lytic murein transglycosylase D
MISGYSSKRFSFASKNFYCSFLAALYAEKYHEEIFGEIPSHFHKKIDSMKLSRSLRPKELASMVDLDIKEFVEYNYDLKKAVHRNSKIPKGLEVFFPKKDLNQSGDASSETTLSPEVGTATRETPNAS